ncbi:MAG TPA: cell surface protein SprA, partial [Cyclobacteriaceae bacterium]|nr:cell surface protein SprA [Cyclobacteriaceae bacterium]
VGLDGVNSGLEESVFKAFIDAVNPQAKTIVLTDPSADNFGYFFSSELDAKDAKILERYKNFNGPENNTPYLTGNEPYAAFGTTLPDNEDLNQDNTLSDLEEYYGYNIDLRPGQLEVGKKFIVDKIVPEGKSDVTWYLFRIPIRQFDEQKGDINGFKSIRYVRMYMTGFTQPVVLRMAKFRAVGNRWRTYTGTLQESNFAEIEEPNLDNFSVSVVNVEENGQQSSIKPAYVPPLKRDRDVTSTVQRRLNEQSVQLCATDLPDGDARSIYKNVSMDFFNYGRLNMFLSIYERTGKEIPDNQLTAFIRLGTDFDQNYYEVELPLKVSKGGEYSLEDVWPTQNQVDLDINELYALKAQRDREGFTLGELYPQAGAKQVGKHGIRILGRPDLSQVKLIMIGVRNPRSDDTKTYSVCMWADELRLTDFDTTPGWATNVVGSAKLADLGQITGSLRYTTFGYGGVQSKISERTRSETLRYDISGNFNVDKLLPKQLGLKIPMFASFENTIINPNFDPANPDLRLKAALSSFNTDAERKNYLNVIQDNSVKRSLNFTNVRKVKLNKNAKSHIYDIENFAFSYAYSEATQTNFNLRENTKRSIKGSVAWQYNSTFKGFEPFKNSKALSSPWLQLIKDFNFNPVPTSISVRGDLDRSFSKIAYRNSTSDAASSIPNYQKFLVFNRFYNVRWNLTKSLTLDYNATANAIVDEPDGDLDNKDSLQVVWDNLKSFGRMKAFSQNISANYTVPLDKLPLTNWIGADYRYNTQYGW